MTRFIVGTLIIIAVVVGAYFFYEERTVPESAPSGTPQDASPAPQTPQGKLMSVESYVSQNISALSPVKESLGGTFYVTAIDVDPETRTGRVEYEDGHNAYAADFSYTASDREGYAITSFVIRK